METPQEKLNRNNKLKADQLRGWLKHHDKANPSLKEAISKAQDEAYERAAQACDYLSGRGYEFDMGRLHCAQAIRDLKDAAPTNEPGNARPGGE